MLQQESHTSFGPLYILLHGDSHYLVDSTLESVWATSLRLITTVAVATPVAEGRIVDVFDFVKIFKKHNPFAFRRIDTVDDVAAKTITLLSFYTAPTLNRWMM